MLLIHVVFRASVAYAIAYAPNGGGLERAHPELGPPPAGARAVSVAAGDATIAAWVLAPPSPRATVVLLHGLRLDRRSLLPFAEKRHAAGYRAVLLDLPGHGESTGTHLGYGAPEARDVSQLLDALHVAGPVGVFGYSYGGAVALHLAARDPRVHAVLTVSTFATPRRAVSDYERRYFPAWVPDRWVDDALGDAAWIGAFDPDVTPTPSRASVVLMHGGADTQISPDNARTLARAVPGARLVVLPGQSHASMLGDPGGAVSDTALQLFASMR